MLKLDDDERAIVDLVEGVVVEGRQDKRFDAVVIDDDLVKLRSPVSEGAWRTAARRSAASFPVRLECSDPATRTVVFPATPKAVNGSVIRPQATCSLTPVDARTD